jgi:hypothetical protein
MRKVGFVLLFAFLAVTVMSLPVLADPFSDVPQDHWAYDAVQMLEEKGLVEGYPDGLFKGDRAMTRYEMAMVVARVIAKLEQVQASIPEIPDLSIYATKQDLEALQSLLDEFRNELDALGVRVNNIEDSLGKLTARVEELERVTISGTFRSIATDIGVTEDIENNLGGPGSVVGRNNVTGDFDRFAGSTLMYVTQQNPAFGPNGNVWFWDDNVFDINPGVDNEFYNYGTVPVSAGGAKFNNPIPSAFAGKSEFALNDGFALTNKLALTVTAKITDNVKAGGDLVAYSAFGDASVYNSWGVVPQYNTIGSIAAAGPRGRLDFQADLATLWFDADGDWDITGEMGNYNLHNVSSNLFYGVRNPYYGFYDTDVIPMNGMDFHGTLYDLIDIEVFYAQDINTVANGQSSVWYLSDPLDIPNSGFFAYPAYRNYLQGIWVGHDALEDKLHIEGAFMRVYEDAASAPTNYTTNNGLVSFGNDTLSVAAQDQLMYGFKGSYTFDDDWMTIYGEWDRTEYRASLQDDLTSQGGNLFQIGAKGDLLDGDLGVYGEYVRTEANYDPFGYHQTWERAYWDGHHEGWDDLTGFGFAVRPGKFRPNRHGLDAGVTYDLAAGEVYADFTWLTQIDPTQRLDGSEDGFNFFSNPALVAGFDVGGFGPLVGRPGFTMGNYVTQSRYNLFGNQDYMFLFDSPDNGDEFFVEVGGRYDFGGNLHIFGGWDYMKFTRDYAAPTTLNGVYVPGLNNNNGRTDMNGFLPGEVGFDINNWANTDFSTHFTHLGVTYDVTENFSVQGNFAYVKSTGVIDYGTDEDNSTIIPGLALRYQFNDTTSIVFDYKYYSFSDDRQPINDYNANKIQTRLNVKF